MIMAGRSVFTAVELQLTGGQSVTERVKLARILELDNSVRRAEESSRRCALDPSAANRAVYCEDLQAADKAAAAADAAGAFPAGAAGPDIDTLRAFLANDIRLCAASSLALPDKEKAQEEFARFHDMASGLKKKLFALASAEPEANNLRSKTEKEKVIRLVLSGSAIPAFILLLLFWVAYCLRRLNNAVVRSRDEMLVLKNGLAQSPLGVMLTDTHGTIEYINPAFSALYGYSPAEAIGKTPRILKSGEMSRSFYQSLWKELLGGRPWTGELLNRTKSKELLWVRAYISPVSNSEGEVTHFIALNKDVTIEKQLMAEVVEAKQEAEQANQAKSDFLAAMSHEIRTPLNAIVGMSELIGEAALNDEQAQYLSIMRNASDTLLSLINDILDISKIEAGKVEIETAPFNLEELLSRVVEMMSTSAFKKDVEINCKIEADVPVFVEGDANRLRQVLMNLIGNAVKFVEKGWISLNVKIQQADGDSVLLLFSLRDTGIGIPADKLDSVLEKFTQADSSTARKYGGTGLGLPISKMLIELMGGGIGLGSKVGVGTVFCFTVNLGIQKDRRDVYLPKADRKELKGRRFLVVDDNLVSRNIIREMLQSWGASCEGAADGETGLARIYGEQSKGAPFHGVFVDSNMPGMDGREFCRRLTADTTINPRPALALVCSDIVQFKKEELWTMGANTQLMKPVKKQTVLDGALGMLAAGKTALSAAPRAAAGYKREDLPALAALVVDDSEDNRILISSFLKGSKVRLQLAVDGFDALKKFKAGAYDIIFMDIQMPEMDGFETTVKLRELEAAGKRVRTRVVALTAMAMREDVDKAFEAGCDDYLTKPIRKDAFYAYLVDFAANRAEG
ncbi:MAG: response regulator [Elusimicrobia bacterium]|nr:response regulator [Elusimicrobiota bacterium]